VVTEARWHANHAADDFVWALREVHKGWFRAAAGSLKTAESAADNAGRLLPPVKVCGCGKRYSAEHWDELPLVGVQDDGVERFAMRNCAGCGSIIALVIRPEAA